jgi:hypothetical protein
MKQHQGKLKLMSGLAAGLALAVAAQAADYSAWTGSRNIVLNTSASGANIANTVTKFPVLVRLTSTEASIVNAAKAGGADIRFSKADGTTPLPYQIDTWEPWGASIWVLVDSVKGNNNSQFIKMYWGNAAAVSESNGGAVFDTANGFVGVWHLGNTAGASPRPNSVAGAPTAQFRNAPITQQPVRGVIGMADSLTGQLGSDNDGDGNEDGKQIHLDMSGTTPYPGYANFTNGISYSVWVNPNGDYQNYERFLQMVDDTTATAGANSDTRIMFLRHTANTGSLAVRTAGLNTNNGNSVNYPQHGGVWKQVGFTKSPGNSSVVMYVDGQVFHTLAASAEIPNTPRPYAWIGRSFNPTDYYLNAKVDAPMLSKVVRGTDWMKLSYENQKPANTLVNIGLGGNITNTPYGIWDHHRTITLNTTSTGAKVSANVYNFPLLIRLTAAEALILSQAKAGGADVRFSKTDVSPPLPYHIESWDSTGAAIWVKMDTVKGNAVQTLRMHWGNPVAVDSSRPAVVFDTANGYRAVFHMNEASGNVTDATVNAVVGANVGTTRTALGLAGPARTFAGTNAANTNDTINRQYINLNNPNALNFAGRITMSAWVRAVNIVGTENESYYRTILNRDGSSPTAEVFLRIGHNAGTADFAQYTTGKYTGSADVMAQSPQPASAYPDSGLWTHLAGAYDSAGPTQRLWRLYRNGVQIATSTDAENAGVTGASTLWRIGRGPGAQNARWWSGDLDEIRISSVTRDSNYIRLSYESQKPGNTLADIGTYVAVPDAPTAVTAARGTAANSITVSWTAPAANGTPAVTGYTVTSTPGNLTCRPVGTATTCTVTGLTAGTSYTFRVVATNVLGNSAPSAPSNAVTRIMPGDLAVRTNGLNPYTYRLPAAAAAVTERLSMTIVDVHGRQVWSRSINPSKGEGNEVTWNGRNAAGTRVSAGMYIVRVSVESAGKTVELDHKGVSLKP